jgi:hypothetical protein
MCGRGFRFVSLFSSLRFSHDVQGLVRHALPARDALDVRGRLGRLRVSSRGVFFPAAALVP